MLIETHGTIGTLNSSYPASLLTDENTDDLGSDVTC